MSCLIVSLLIMWIHIHPTVASVQCVMRKHQNVIVCLTMDQDSPTGNRNMSFVLLFSLFFSLSRSFMLWDLLFVNLAALYFLMKIDLSLKHSLLVFLFLTRKPIVLLPSRKCVHHALSCYGINGVTYGWWHGIVRRDYTIISCSCKRWSAWDSSAGMIGASG